MAAKKVVKKEAKKAKPEVHGNSKYKENFHPQDAIRMASQGHTIAMMCAEWMVARDRYYEWQQRHPSFRDSIKRAAELRKGYWEKVMMRVALGLPINQQTHGKDANTAALIFWMKNVCNWTDRASMEVTAEEIDELIFE